MASQQTLDAYVAFFERMTREDLVRLPEFFSQQAHFKDPFNDVYGIERISTIFYHMFDTLTAPKFVIEEAVLNADVAYIKWQFTGVCKAKPIELIGVSRVVFDQQSLVLEHIDYWDASEQFYMKLPLIGTLLRFIRRQASN